MSLSGKDYTMRQPFSNPTSFKVGQIRTVDQKQFVVSAIIRVTDKQFKIYGVPMSADLRLTEYIDYQKRREKGQVKIYVPGQLILQTQVDLK